MRRFRFLLILLALMAPLAACEKKGGPGDAAIKAAALAEANKKVVARWVDELNKENMGYLQEVIHNDFVDHNPFPGVTPNKEGYIKLLTLAHAEWFPGIQVKIEDAVAQGDKVALRLSVEAVHKGTVMGAPPTGKTLTWGAYAIYRVKDGQLIERWEMLDSASFMMQLGLMQMAPAKK